jgi:hypothetical protein
MGFSLDKIPPSTKLIFALVVFVFIALGMVWMLKKVTVNEKKAKIAANPDKKKK